VRSRPINPRAAALVASVALLVLGAAGCGGESETATPPTETTTTQEPPVTTEEPPATTETEPEPPAATTLRIVVHGGKPTGGIMRVTVKKGEQVTLVVVSDRADEVHLHGYDLTANTAPGMNARIAFVAKLPGRFEIELEDAGLQIGELEVRP